MRRGAAGEAIWLQKIIEGHVGHPDEFGFYGKLCGVFKTLLIEDNNIIMFVFLEDPLAALYKMY